MSFDAHANLALTSIVAGPIPALSGTSITVATGTGSRFPAAPFNCTIYPPNEQPMVFNAEIVRVTAVVGDVLTIVRAQEGTTAKAIKTGYWIANTITVKAITDIENAIAISAGTQSFQGPFTFQDGGGITFGMSNGTVTAIVSGGGGTGGVAISAGAASQGTGTVVFADANGVTFGLTNGSITASVVPGAANVAFSASGGSSSFQTLEFANSNGITFSNSNGSVVASHNGLTSQSNQAFSASGGSSAFQTLNFANSNGITFSNSNGSVIASHNGITQQSTQPVAVSASNGSFNFSTLNFSNSNGVTFGTSAGGIITASVGAAGGGLTNINVSAGATSYNLSNITFSDANGVTFGITNSVITASVNPAAAGAPASWYQNQPIVSFSVFGAGVSTKTGGFFQLPYDISASFVRAFATFNAGQLTNLTTAAASLNASVECYSTFHFGIYSQGTGASSNSIVKFAEASAPWTIRNSISIAANGTEYSVTQGFTGITEGNQFTFTRSYASTQTLYQFFSSGFLTGFTGTIKFVDMILDQSISAGNYWCLIGLQSSTSSGASRITGATNCNIGTGGFEFHANAGGNFIGGGIGQTNTVLGVQQAGFQMSSNVQSLGTIFDMSTGLSQNGAGLNPIFQIIRKA